MYYRGTLAEFNQWHAETKAADGITEDGNIGFRNGVPDNAAQRVIAYSDASQHPDGTDDYVWQYFDYPDEQYTPLTRQEVEAEGFFAGDRLQYGGS